MSFALTPFSVPSSMVLADWSAAMGRARMAHHGGQCLTAMAFYRQGLDLARQALGSHQPEEAEAGVPALVASSEGLAALNEEQERPDLAMQVLVGLHRSLLDLIRNDPPRSQRRQTALWHSHGTHGALMAWAQQHGWSPVIEAAVRAGCMGLSVSPAGSRPH